MENFDLAMLFAGLSGAFVGMVITVYVMQKKCRQKLEAYQQRVKEKTGRLVLF